ncbi:peptidoglycan DD-metalloendopeptidase family protein [Roseiarcaceae bacterium H3SJ34-1]|uniref:murein hydrolase activator EnvC family protein n=1 Tax=Terripilifer ovatus TaxID=3032367 RepID=UPI003AB9595A|nr:peptidoglycan DD-metalloendopeptidase family protein [Roseiarcaceae bacterium H3SJ34-1]
MASKLSRSINASVLSLSVLAASQLGLAQTKPPAPPAGTTPAPTSGPANGPAPAPSPERERIDARQQELRNIEQGLRASEEQRRKIEIELESIRSDRTRLNAALVDTAAKMQAGEQRSDEVERRLEASIGSEDAIKRSLEARRGVIAEILAGLQRMGRNPPPAVLIAPEDILKAIRTSMMMGAVLPELRAETQVLVADLGELVELRKKIAVEKDRLAVEARAMAGERERLAALIEARRNAMGETEQALQAERAKAQLLGRQALDLKDLIARLEAEVGSAQRAAEAARKADAERQQTAALKPPDPRKSGSPFADSTRLKPAIAFSDAKKLLPLPVSGSIVKNFGAPDGFGSSERGIYMSTRAGALVASPTDGWVLFSGTFRTYGQLLIINAGGGYYILLAGMARNTVEVGQFVLVGEPVGVMGDASARNAAALAIGATQPVLYVEFRKDGTAIDPSPWWAKPEVEKVRG